MIVCFSYQGASPPEPPTRATPLDPTGALPRTPSSPLSTHSFQYFNKVFPNHYPGCHSNLYLSLHTYFLTITNVMRRKEVSGISSQIFDKFFMKNCMRNSERGDNFTRVISALASLGQLTSHSRNCRFSPLVAQYTILQV